MLVQIELDDEAMILASRFNRIAGENRSLEDACIWFVRRATEIQLELAKTIEILNECETSYQNDKPWCSKHDQEYGTCKVTVKASDVLASKEHWQRLYERIKNSSTPVGSIAGAATNEAEDSE